MLCHTRLMPQDQSPFQESLETAIMKRRRGRQPRQSLVTLKLLQAIATLTSQLGAPKFLEEEGFRDISGWLNHIKGSQFRNAWLSLCQSFIGESHSFEDQQHDKLKEDLVQEIMKLVITRNPRESGKVVNTNARRQSKVSKSGQTVRNVFEAYLEEAKETSAETKRRSEGSQAGSSHSHARLQRRNVSTRSGSSSRSPGLMMQGSSSGMDISSLLTNDRHPTQKGTSSSSRSSSPKLPSMTQFDEEIRVRSEKDSSSRK